MLKNQLKQNIISADKIDGTFDSIELTEDIIFIKNRFYMDGYTISPFLKLICHLLIKIIKG